MSAAAHTAGTVPGAVAGARFIDPRVLARIANLDLVARAVVDGFISGLHRAVHLGVSTDFAEHRPYVPGDDVRRIDWRVFARTDRLYIKTFEAETNADLVLALDISRSMDFASGEVSKLDYARMLLASLAHLGSRQRDRVALATFDEDLVELLPASARRRDTVLHTLERLQVGGSSDFATALRRIGQALHRRSIVVVVSDFYADPVALVVALDELRVRGHDVIAFQVLDPRERRLDLDDAEVLEDLETGERLPVQPREIRAEYRRLVDAHSERLAKGCGEHRVDFAGFDTDQPLDHALFRFLSNRARLARKR